MRAEDRAGTSEWVESTTPGVSVDARRFAQVLRITGIGIFEHDHASGTFYWSPEARRIFGIADGASPSLEHFFSVVHPEDRAGLVRAVMAARARTGAVQFEATFRVCPEGAAVLWVDMKCESTNEDGDGVIRPGRLVGAVVDVTALRRQHEEMRLKDLAMDGSSGGILILDADFRIVYTNAAYRRLMAVGGHVDERGRSVFDVSGSPEVARQIADRIRADGHWSGDVSSRRRDGRNLDVQAACAALRDANGTVSHYVISALDLSDLKRTEASLRASLAEKEALLTEVHHRVKNNLQVVSSLLNLQAARLTHPETIHAIRDTQLRVRAMALLHEALYRTTDLSRVSLDGYLESVARHIARSSDHAGRVKLELAVEPIVLEAERALPCGLLVNELLVNAMRHAFPDGREGRIELTARVDGQEVVVEVRDDGVGLPEGAATDRAGAIGLRLLPGFAEQLGGVVRLSSDGGTVGTLRFPLSSEAA